MSKRMAVDYAGICVSALVGVPDARMATKYIAPDFVVKATRQHKHDKRDRRFTFIVTMGPPNYLQTKFVKDCKKAGVKFPVQKVQLKYWPKKRK